MNNPFLPPEITLQADTYWAAQPIEVQALRNSPNAYADAQKLALAGFLIDVPCMLNNPEIPGMIMYIRAQAGFRWAPNALQGMISTTGLLFGAMDAYFRATPQPVGAIRVSYKAEDYPPTVHPVDPPKPTVNEIGNPFGFSMPDPITGKMCGVYGCSAQIHHEDRVLVTNEQGQTFRYVLLGTTLMSTSQRTAVWLLQGVA